MHLLHILHSDMSQDHLDYMGSLTHHPHVRLYAQADLSVFLRQNPADSIAVVELDYHDLGASRGLLDRLRRCGRVIALSMEYGRLHEDLIADHDLPNFEWIAPCAPALSHALHIANNPWLVCTQQPYFHDPRFRATDWQARLLPGRRRDRTFEVMLGLPRPHRDFCRQWVRAHVDPAHYLMSEPFHAGTRINELPTSSVFREPECSADPRPYHVQYLGRSMMQSTVLPIALYEQTQHSVVCETRTDVCFPTEKTCKPIMAQRLFVVLSCRGYLRHLRLLGFRTFGNVIDESYDSEPNDIVRWRRALEQMRSLVGRPWPELWPQLQPVVAHNLQRLRSLPANVLLERVRRAVGAGLVA
jgi:hypothetical protein